MIIEELKKRIDQGEKIDVEFKKSENDLNKDVYKSVCAFNNWNGGDLFLGVVDGTKEIRGVNPDRIDKMFKDFTSNILAHRDYSNAYTAQFVIEKDKIFTKNSNLPHGHGELQLNKFEPYPKNPPISKVFREIGYADELGSGMRNTNKYTKLYSGGTPVFVEDNFFEIVIPMENVANLQVGPEKMKEENSKETNKETNKETDKETNKEINKKTSKETAEKIIEILEKTPSISVNEMSEILNISVGGIRYHINKMKKSGILEHEGSTKKGKWIIKK